MKKVDLHVHTIPSVKDAPFDFSLEKLVEYVSNSGLDAIAITNHDMFDVAQFREVREALGAVVLPGIEVSLDCGHVLVITDDADLHDFKDKADQVGQRVSDPADRITLDEFERIFGDLSHYLVIPHYDKKPQIKGTALDRMAGYVSAGEVDSAKKFLRAIKSNVGPCPVLFSDARIGVELSTLPTRQTFVDCGEVTLGALKSSFSDGQKVALSESDGNALIQVFDDGQMISTGLNVLLGERSSGKTFTLNKLSALNANVQYIEQFSLVQKDGRADERQFNSNLERDRSQLTEEYLSAFKVVVSDVMGVDLRSNDRMAESYVETLLKSAEEADRQDAYSKTALFDESEFTLSDDQVLSHLIGSVRQLIENIEYRSLITQYVDRTSLQRLACVLIELYWQKARDTRRKKLVNGLVADIKAKLKMRTSAVPVTDVDLYRLSIDGKKVERFTEIVELLRRDATISEDSIQGFKVVARHCAFVGAGEIRAASGVAGSFRDAFAAYSRPYDYLQELRNIESLRPSELYKLFAKITYIILNRDGFEVSGGERSEFRLLQEIADAQNYDFLLIDEPESSFDNLFLKSDVNEIIKEISRSMPVVVVTHNSTVGASIRPDYVLYARKDSSGSGTTYRLYSGYPTDRELTALDGSTISNCDIMLNSLEAGREAYEDRRRGYEALED